MALQRSLRGLDWFNFFTANVQTGFGPFISVYLTAEKWTQVEIGFVLSVGTIAAMVCQVPAGAVVDAARDKRKVAGASMIGVALAALLLAVSPSKLAVLLSQILHAFSSGALGPSIAAISLALIGLGAVGERLGRNAQFASVGNGIAAALMGAIGYYLSERAVFLLTAALVAPALIALSRIRGADVAVTPPHTTRATEDPVEHESVWHLLRDRRLAAFAACIVLFQLGNAAILPLAAAEATKESAETASLLIAAAVVVPQFVVAICSRWAGRVADRWGRKPVLLLGLAVLPVRGVLFAGMVSAQSLVAVQVLDGISGAAFGVLIPLIAADLTRGTNRFNLCQGVLGLAAGLGATVSTTMGGAIADSASLSIAFLALAAAGIAGFLVAVFAMPETRPRRARPPSRRVLETTGAEQK